MFGSHFQYISEIESIIYLYNIEYQSKKLNIFFKQFINTFFNVPTNKIANEYITLSYLSKLVNVVY